MRDGSVTYCLPLDPGLGLEVSNSQFGNIDLGSTYEEIFEV